jgi:hypothetical protein
MNKGKKIKGEDKKSLREKLKPAYPVPGIAGYTMRKADERQKGNTIGSK